MASATASTPPPSSGRRNQSRARTPPTPLHGPKHDAYEPYSPRRSSRIHNKDAGSVHSHSHTRTHPNSHSQTHSHMQPSRSPSQQHAPPKTTKRSMMRTNSQTYSPPSSPISSPPSEQPSKTKHHSSPSTSTAGHPNASTRHYNADSDDMDMHDGSTAFSRRDAMNDFRSSRSGLPTPMKTPKKRGAPSQSSIASASRVLFPSKPHEDDDELMPSPRKAPRAKRHTAFGLASFAEESERLNGGPIEIYTDSNERVPEVDESEENPFLVRRSSRRTTTAQHPRPSDSTMAERIVRPGKTKYGMTKEIDEAVDNNEGMVYVFRGKKIFRRFDDIEPNSASAVVGGDDLGGESLNDRQTRRQIGIEASRPFTRSAMKPRLLFPPKHPVATTEEEEAEEALTDVEGPALTQDGDRTNDSQVSRIPTAEESIAEQSLAAVATPVKKHTYPSTSPATPPASSRRGRKTNGTVLDTKHDGPEGPGDVADASQDEAPATLHGHRHGQGQKRSAGPFDTWQRTKVTSGSPPSAAWNGKRHAVEEVGAGERTRPSSKRAKGS